MSLLSTPGGNRGTGHFYLAKNRTFLLCVDSRRNLAVPIIAHGVCDTIDIALLFLGKYPGL
ncbi:MAG: hypothetical protein DMG48_12925 [Acidobacteria bacterium]|nr:MAG: hypothetical protein DMG48_12925 [Acidobacteriota bacterium]